MARVGISVLKMNTNEPCVWCSGADLDAAPLPFAACEDHYTLAAEAIQEAGIRNWEIERER